MKKQLEREYALALNAIVDELFQVAADKHMTWSSLAKKSGLSYQTVRKLGERGTKFPQYRTVQMIAAALGGKVQFSKGLLQARPVISWKPKIFAA